MSLKVILTLVVAFVIVVFSLFNAEQVFINLFGVKKVNLPMSFLVFFAFILGAAYAAVLSFQMQIEQALTIRKLKRRVQEYRDLLQEREGQEATAMPKETRAATDDAKEPAPAAPRSKGRQAFFPMAARKASTSPQSVTPKNRDLPATAMTAKTKDAAGEAAGIEEPDINGLSADEDDEAVLPASLKEIALRRIQNG
jgi:uncharacterized integral membrane protein